MPYLEPFPHFRQTQKRVFEIALRGGSRERVAFVMQVNDDEITAVVV
jgi:hypothetical protein